VYIPAEPRGPIRGFAHPPLFPKILLLYYFITAMCPIFYYILNALAMCPILLFCRCVCHAQFLLYYFKPCKIQPRDYPKTYSLLLILYFIFLLFPNINLQHSFADACTKACRFHRLSLRANTRCGLQVTRKVFPFPRGWFMDLKKVHNLTTCRTFLVSTYRTGV